MNNHQCSRSAGMAAGGYLRSAFILACCAMGSMALHAQEPATQQCRVQVTLDSYTAAEPSYGASYRYSWEDIRAYSGEERGGKPMKMDLEMINDEGGGLFMLLSQPIVVPESGMHIRFHRHVVMHPSDAERGTSLSNGPREKCSRSGSSRAIFHHRIALIDAVTGEYLAPGHSLDDHGFTVSRHQVLDDIDDRGEVDIDLDAFANRQVRLRTIVLLCYSGRGAIRSTAPAISSVCSILPTMTRQDLR